MVPRFGEQSHFWIKVTWIFQSHKTVESHHLLPKFENTIAPPKPATSCSKLTIGTLEKGLKYVQN